MYVLGLNAYHGATQGALSLSGDENFKRNYRPLLPDIRHIRYNNQNDINQIIIAMQFQDITRQKLERLHKPALEATGDSLSLLSHETQALLQRDLYRAVRAYAQSAIKPRLGERDGAEGDGKGLDAMGPAAEGDGTGRPRPRRRSRSSSVHQEWREF